MTFSLAGRCARTGMFGVVVTTSSIAVGSRCPYGAAMIGAALTQNRTDPQLGPLMIDLMRRGFSAQQTMDAVVAVTPYRHWRQLACIDMTGRTAAFTGANVKGELGESHGDNCVAIANIVRSDQVPVAMVRAFEADPSAPIGRRLIAALQAGEEAGSEFRPLVSTALLVVHKESFPYIDLRVDRDPTPVATLARLLIEYEPMADLYVTRAVDPESIVAPI